MIRLLILLLALACGGAALTAQDLGTIRGAVTDKDFDVPVADVQVTIAESGRTTKTNDQGVYTLAEVPVGRWTLIFSKDGYVRQVKADVLVEAAKLTDLDLLLTGEVTEMEEFVVEDTLVLGGGTEAGLLQMRFDSPALQDSISAELMSRAGAGDAASALKLVAGATVQNGKTAVIRGLPDRYVSSQLNGVRLPSAVENKRAVELDQFPASIIENIIVSKTFTPDQQGDASGGAVNLKLKGIPDDPFFVHFKAQTSWNTNVTGESKFLSYDGGGVNFLGFDDGERDPQIDRIGGNWDGAVGTMTTDAPIDHKWSLDAGGKLDLDDDLKVGGFGALFYERDSNFYSNGKDEAWWVEHPGSPMTPRQYQGSAQGGDFRTGLFDVTRGQELVQWGGLATIGAEWKEQKLSVLYFYSRTVEDTATLAIDTRGKEYYFPGYDPADPTSPGFTDQFAAPYVRLETLDYVERSTDTLQFNGRHKIPVEGFGFGDIEFKKPEFDWTVALSSASLNEPDKRQFGEIWVPEYEIFPGFSLPAAHYPYKPGANFTLGNEQRIFKKIDEDSTQFFFNLKLPFKNWTSEDGFVKSGFFHDDVERRFNQDSYSNFSDPNNFYNADYDHPWSAVFPTEDHFITASDFDVDYRGTQEITAYYGMLSLPLIDEIRLIGGARVETTELGIVNVAEPFATWFPPGSLAPTVLNPGDADVAFEREDVLPSIGLEIEPLKDVIVRVSYNGTIARPTFKEMTPIIQQEYLGGPIFIGNPDLSMSTVDNYDVRIDWNIYSGGLLSASWFKKDIKDPIEYVQKVGTFDYTTAENYPEGTLSGLEFELRQDLGHFTDYLKGLSIGANATFIKSEVTLPADEAAEFEQAFILAPMKKRDMTNAPDHLYNFYLTYDLEETGTAFSIFYTIQGDTLIAGAGESQGNYVPNVYATEFGTLNLSITQKIGEYFKLQFQAKNLTDPDIKTVYRSKYIGDDVLKTSFTRGMEFSLSLSAEIKF